MSAPAARLFIPGPTHVRSSILAAQAEPMFGHRGQAMKDLLAECLPGVRSAFGTTGDVVILSCSSTAAMEGVGRSVARPGKKVLHLVNGNFSNLWWKLSEASGIETVKAELPWGEAWDEANVEAELDAAGPVDAVFIAHCETSTGVLSDIAGVARAVRGAQPDAMVCVDVTSSACGVAIDFDTIDIDVAVGGVQKCWALPPALALAALSPRCKARMDEVPGRGYTNDLRSALDYQDSKGMTSTTPAIPVMRSLRTQLHDIEASGGMQARFDRHLAMQKMVLDWAAGHGFGTLAQAGYRSPSVTSIAMEGRFVMAALVKGYAEADYFITGGYGKTKETHWRIGHMGDHTPDCLGELLGVTDGILDRIGCKSPASA